MTNPDMVIDAVDGSIVDDEDDTDGQRKLPNPLAMISSSPADGWERESMGEIDLMANLIVGAPLERSFHRIPMDAAETVGAYGHNKWVSFRAGNSVDHLHHFRRRGRIGFPSGGRSRAHPIIKIPHHTPDTRR